MTQRVRTPNGANMETVICEKFMARLLENDLRYRTNGTITNQKFREKNVKLSCMSPTSKSKAYSKVISQINKTSQSPRNLLEYSDEAALVKVTVKAPHKRQRSRNRSIDKEPWGQILKYEKSNENLSVFSNFDPLRTLHFLIKELQIHLQRMLSDEEDKNVSQIMNDMQAALKRVPPEVASIIHLQPTNDVKQNIRVSEQETQTPTSSDTNEKFKENLEENLTKFEAKYRELESLCSKLRNEKFEVEKQLLAERETAGNYRQRIEDLENTNSSFLTPKIRNLENEKEKLESDIECLSLNYETRYSALLSEMKSQISELKAVKLSIEQENMKLKHQIRVLNIEKEKYVTVLEARDRQINEIRGEMSHLQETVNEQLMELQKNVIKTFPSTSVKVKRENIGDWSGTYTNNDDDEVQQPSVDKSVRSVKDFPSGDVDIPEKFTGNKCQTNDEIATQEDDLSVFLEKIDSHTSIRSLFDEVKRTALSISKCPNYQFNPESTKKK